VIARERLWHRGGDVLRYEAGGILIVSGAQPTIKQPVRDIAVVSLYYARAVMGALPSTLRSSSFSKSLHSSRNEQSSDADVYIRRQAHWVSIKMLLLATFP